MTIFPSPEAQCGNVNNARGDERGLANEWCRRIGGGCRVPFKERKIKKL